jgi:NAD(P)-dependent dehydrogenase (short-subunit alcohol dehydrogenase family)
MDNELTDQRATLQGRVALVIGASQGIGRAYAVALAKAGATVVGAARTISGGDGVVAMGCDVERESDVIRLIQQCIDTFGQLDIVVNNAALYPRLDALSVDAGEWDRNMNVNVRGPYFVLREVLPHMISRGSGSIINITSRSASFTKRAHPAHRNLMVYAVTKAALDRLTTWFAEEMRPHGIAVNALSPGGVLTDGWRREAPEEYAAAQKAGAKLPLPEIVGPALVFLAQQTAQTLTGQILHTDNFGKTWPETATVLQESRT